MERIIIDTDPGIDDPHAIMLASAHPGSHIEALTTVAGNVDVDKAMANSTPGELTLVALGPLTNLAIAVKIDPELPRELKRTIAMGGAYLAKGNSRLPAAEFNFYVDPEAAYVVLEAWEEVTIVPWETSIAHALTVDQVQQLGSYQSRRAEFFRKATANRLVPQISGPPALHASDGLAMLVAVEPDGVVSEEHRYASVELGGAATRGQLIVDWYQLCQKPPNARIVTAVDHTRFLSLLAWACGPNPS